jgi:Rad3-related DNA helicase
MMGASLSWFGHAFQDIVPSFRHRLVRSAFPGPHAGAGGGVAAHQGRAGRNVLIAAPTGSGKTLAAFMAAIDDLVRQGIAGGLKDETQILYVSPLKALSNDIRRNLDAPIAGIRRWIFRRAVRAAGRDRQLARNSTATRCRY